ncbi:MAG: hypothetical protein HKN33_05165 [Pyrinomonadaceae bacterium]|nr:hypothetical protein [Pyrinomonadaceae bacterium]
MKQQLVKLVIGSAAIFLVLVMVDTASAQRTRKARGKTYTRADVERVIKRVEERVDNFVDNFDDSLDNSNLDGSEREDNLMDRARELESATDELRREFDRNDTWIENKAEVRDCLRIASKINKTMRARRFGAKTESNWAKVRFELNTLAKIYRLPAVGSSAYN